MANRPVFVTFDKIPYVRVFHADFQWNGGFAVSQKQKNITAMHNEFKRAFPRGNPLEISSKSMQEHGVKLSAFNLKKFVPSLGYSVPVECVFQGGKKFAAGGPYTDLYTASPKDAKRDERLKTSGMLRGFWFEGQDIPLVPRSAFYNWIYINALMENPELAELLLAHDGFTDVEFNPEKSLNCQAEAAAVFVSLSRLGLLDQCRDFESFAKLFKRS